MNLLFLSSLKSDEIICSVNFANPDDENKTPLQCCVLSTEKDSSDWHGIETAELLIQNGAKTNQIGDQSKSLLDIALLGNSCEEMLQYLKARISN